MVEDASTVATVAEAERQVEPRAEPDGAGPLTVGDRIASRMGVRPSSGVDEPYLDGLRALAVIAVVVVHAHGNAARPPIGLFGVDLTFIPLNGTYGVLLFFVLSGFLLARPWFRAELTGSATPKLGRFYGRRFLRIAPAYYVSLALLLLIFVPSPVSPGNVQGQLGVVNLGTHLLFLQQLVPIATGHFSGVGGVYWTLTMEVIFYAVLPFVIVAFTGRRWRITIPVAAAMSALWLYVAQVRFGALVQRMIDGVSPADSAVTSVPATAEHMHYLLTFQFPAYLFTFALGIGLARMAVLREVRLASDRPSGPAWWERPHWGAAGLAFGVALVLLTQRVIGEFELHPEPRSMVLNVSLNMAGSFGTAVAVYGVAFGPAWVRRPLGVLPMRYIGWTSYGIYLYHVPIISLLNTYTVIGSLSSTAQFVALLGLVFVLSTGVATASWLLIERPILQWRPARADRSFVLVGGLAVVCVLAAVLVGFRVAPAVAAAAPVASGVAPLVPATVDDGVLQPASTGDATLEQALARGTLYPFQEDLLAGCATGSDPIGPVATGGGTTMVIVAPDWSVLGSAFGCRDAASAQVVVDQMSAWEGGRGATEVAPAGRAGWPAHGAFFIGDQPATPGYPAQFQVFYVSGDRVVGLLVQARSEAAGTTGTADLLAAISAQYPPTA